MGTDLVKDPRVLEAAYDDAAGRHGRVQPQRAARAQPRARRRLRPGRLRARRAVRPRARVDRDAPARDARAARARSCAARPRRCTSTPARSCAPRSAPSSRASGSRATSPRPASSSARWLTDPDGLFALASLAAPATAPTGQRCRLRRAWTSRAVGASSSAAPPGSARRPSARCTSAARVVTIADVNAEKGEALAAELGRASSSPATCARRSRSQAAVEPAAAARRRAAHRGLLRRHRLGAEGRRLQGPAPAAAVRDDHPRST